VKTVQTTHPAVRRTLVLGALALLAAGCGGTSRAESGTSPTSTTSATVTSEASTTVASPSTPAPSTDGMASLGDSYSSGEGNPPFDAGTDILGQNRCHRSATAWPRQLGVSATSHLACSGAVIADLADQTAALAALKPAPNVVFITIGGNDLGFSSIIAGCFTHPAGTPCWTDADYAKAKEHLATVVGPQLEAAYRSVKAAVPGARVIVASYPDLFATDGTDVGCPWLDAESHQRIVAAQVDLSAAMAARAAAAGVEFVDLLHAYPGHELCTSDSYVAAVNLTNAINASAAHPTAKGQAAMAAMVGKYLSGK